MTSPKRILTLLGSHFCRLRCQVGRSQLEVFLLEALNELLDVIREQRVGANRTFHELLKQLKVAYLAEINTCDIKHKSQRNCNRPRLIAHFDREVKRLGLDATPRSVDEEGVRYFLDKLSNIMPCALKGYRGCTPSRHDFGHLTILPVEQARYLTLGLCMVCVKQCKLSVSPDSFCAWRHIADAIMRLEGKERGDSEQDLISRRRRARYDLRGLYEDLGIPTEAGIAMGDLFNHNCMSSTRWQHKEYYG